MTEDQSWRESAAIAISTAGAMLDGEGLAERDQRNAQPDTMDSSTISSVKVSTFTSAK